MTALTYPKIAQTNVCMIHDALADQSRPIPLDEAHALVEISCLISAVFAGFLKGLNESLAEGVGSQALRAKLEEGIPTTAFALAECAALQERLDDNPAVRREPREHLRKAAAEIRRVQEELLSISAWLANAPPSPSAEKLLEASQGPFAPMRN